jgi:hypothetical protein
MAERWCAGHSGKSVRKISRIVAGIDPASPLPEQQADLILDSETKPEPQANPSLDNETGSKPESVAKRLARRFMDLQSAGEALPISVHRIYEQERKLAFKRRRDLGADKDALRIAADRCQLRKDEVQALEKQGRRILIDRLNDARQNSQ